MRIALLKNDVVESIVIAELGFFPNGIEDKGYTVGDLVDPSNGVVITPAPSIVEPTHKTEFIAQDFMDALTDEEFDLLDASPNPSVKKIMRQLEVRRRTKMDVTSSKYIAAVGVLRARNVLTQERHDEFLLGIPID